MTERRYQILRDPGVRWWNFPYEVTVDGLFAGRAATMRGARYIVKQEKRKAGKQVVWDSREPTRTGMGMRIDYGSDGGHQLACQVPNCTWGCGGPDIGILTRAWAEHLHREHG